MLILGIVPALFCFNLFLIQKGILFTGYRDMLFFFGYDYVPPFVPVFIFLFCYLVLIWAIWNNNFPQIEALHNSKIFLIFLVFLTLISQFFFIWTPETNPDFVRYIYYAQIFDDKGIIYYFTEWGSGFATHVDLPTGSLPFGIIFSLFGETRLVIQVFSITITIVTAYFIFLLGEKIISKKCGMIASCLFLSFPFLLTQIPLMLVDVISTFYITLFSYFAYGYLIEQKARDLILSAIFFFLTAFSKILSPLFLTGILAGLLIITLIQEDTIRPYQRLTLLFAFTCIPCALYFMQLSEQFSGPILTLSKRFYDFPWDWSIICGGMIIGIIIFLISPLILYNLKKKFCKFRSYNLPLSATTILIIGMYGLLFVLSIFDVGKSYFYIRSLPNAIGIIPAILALISIALIIRKKHVMAIPLVLGIIIPILVIPNPMYKYFLPAYPALALVSAMTVCWIEDVRLQKCITISAIMAGMIIALFVLYPMCLTDSQINIQKSAEYFNNEKTGDQKIQVFYIPTTERYQDIRRIDIFSKQLPAWFNYYGDRKHDYSVSTVRNNDEYSEIINESNERNVKNLVIITDARDINNDILIPSVLNYYSIMKVFNQGYHNGYWFNTQQVVIMEKTQKIIVEDKGIIDDKVYLQTLNLKVPILSNYEPPLSIKLEFEDNSTNTFVIYDWYNESFHRSDTIYYIKPGVTEVTYTITRPTDAVILHLHELNKIPLKIKRVSMKNETLAILSQSFRG